MESTKFAIIIVILIIFIAACIAFTYTIERRQETAYSGPPRFEVLHWPKYYEDKDAIEHPDTLFVFNDNDAHQGNFGSAVLRDFNNAVGVSTKRNQFDKITSYWLDENFDINKKKIDDSFDEIRYRLRYGNFKRLALPKEGLGQGLSQLNTIAPKTYKYLQLVIKKFIAEYNGKLLTQM